MKYIIFFFSTVILLIYTQKEFRLNGKYQMQYEQKYSSQNCIINFQDSVYTRKLLNGKSINGHINYKKFSITLNDDKSSLQMDFAKREVQNDTIFFGTKDLNDKPSGGDLTVNSGKLIKVKW